MRQDGMQSIHQGNRIGAITPHAKRKFRRSGAFPDKIGSHELLNSHEAAQMMSLQPCVIWDMDGVLIDTSEYHFLAWARTLQDYGIAYTGDMHEHFFGMKNADFLPLVFAKELDLDLVAEIGERKEDLFRRAIKGKTVLLPGAKQWLDWLSEKGVIQALASSAPQANVDAMVGETGIRPYFAAIVSTANLPGKPDPAVFLQAAHEVGIPPQRCIVIEDSIAGVQAAKNAGMRCIAVSPHSDGRLGSADIVVKRLDALVTRDFERLLGGSNSPGNYP
jgi:beta-phosphoglucomutase